MQIRLISSEALTVQEIQASYLARVDLGPGYPQLPLPSYIRNIYLDDEIHRLSLKHPPHWTPADQSFTDDELCQSVRAFLGIAGTPAIAATFSGGVALDRALAAAIQVGVTRGATHTHIITCTPSIDIMRLLLAERGSSLTVHFVENREPAVGKLNLEGVLSRLDTIRSTRPSDNILVLLTSPENPTGEIWSHGALVQIGSACTQLNAILIVDHAYLTAGVHNRLEVPCVWDVMPHDADWIGIWDTGKTFGLNEDKLGFLVSSATRVRVAVESSLANLQFDVSRRQKLFFARLLTEALSRHYLATLTEVCRTNLETAASLSASAPIQLRAAPAGSLALLELLDSRRSDDTVRRLLLAHGVGVVSGRVFFHTTWRPRSFLRIALARDPDYFCEAFGELVHWLAKICTGSGQTRLTT